MKKKLILIVSQSLLVWSVCFFPLPLLPNRLAVRLPSWSISSISPSISRILGLIASSVVCLATLLCFWDGSSGAIVGISVLSCCFWCAGGKSDIHSWLYGKVFLRFNKAISFLLKINKRFDSFSPDLLCLGMEQFLFIFTQVKGPWFLEVNMRIQERITGGPHLGKIRIVWYSGQQQYGL